MRAPQRVARLAQARPCSSRAAATSATSAAKNGLFGHVLPALERDRRCRRAACMQPRNAVPYFSRQPLLGDRARRRPSAPSAAPRRGRRRAGRAGRTSAGRCSRRGRGGSVCAMFAVVLAALVGVADQERDRRAGGLAFVDAGEDLDRVGFLPLRDVARGAGAAPVEVGLDVGLATAPCRAGSRRSRSRSPGRGDSPKVVTAEQRAEGVAAHAEDYPQSGRASVEFDDGLLLVAARRPASRGCRP